MKLEFKSMIKPSSDYRTIVAIDAMDFSDDPENAFRSQLSEANLKRELYKAYTGFSAFDNVSIDTGHWGCGAFCGKSFCGKSSSITRIYVF